jgi:hypothetical protein
MPKEAVFVATWLAAAFGSTLMGLYANYPARRCRQWLVGTDPLGVNQAR